MATATFNKYIAIKYDTTNYPTDTRNLLSRTYTDKVVGTDGVTPDPTQIFVSYNGQRIQRRVAETAGTFARFYYEITAHTSTGFTVNIVANPTFTMSGYSGAPSVSLSIQDNDIFFLDFTHQVTI